MDYVKLFYWLTVADNSRVMFGWGIALFTIVTVIALIGMAALAFDSDYDITNDEGNKKTFRQWKRTMQYGLPFVFFFWACYVLTPSKRDALLIVGGGQTLNYLTTDSVAKQIPREMSNFVVSELRNMANDAGVELSIAKTKQEILNEAKNMTGQEILERMKIDEEFKNIINSN